MIFRSQILCYFVLFIIENFTCSRKVYMVPNHHWEVKNSVLSSFLNQVLEYFLTALVTNSCRSYSEVLSFSNTYMMMFPNPLPERRLTKKLQDLIFFFNLARRCCSKTVPHTNWMSSQLLSGRLIKKGHLLAICLFLLDRLILVIKILTRNVD